jgi:hypothetical protein
MGLLFIFQVVYADGEPWWNDIDRGKILIRSPELSGHPINSLLIENQEKLAKEIMKLATRNIFIHTSRLSFYLP